MQTALLTHSDCLGHVNPPGHPELADRLRAIQAALEAEEFAYLLRQDAPLAEDAQILRAHAEDYLRAIVARSPKQHFAYLDPDTSMCPGSLAAARRAAGAVVAAVDLVMRGEARNAFCAVGPPGIMPRRRRRAMGFACSTMWLSARAMPRGPCAKRVAIVDFDVHHGNGTQDLFWNDPSLFSPRPSRCRSIPAPERTPSAAPTGKIVNAPLPRVPASPSSALR